MLSNNVVEVEELFNSNSLRNSLRTRNEQKTNGVPYSKHHHPHGRNVGRGSTKFIWFSKTKKEVCTHNKKYQWIWI
jgi:hypothetical protein